MAEDRPQKTRPALLELYYILRPQKATLLVVLGLSVVLSFLNAAVPYSLKLVLDIMESGQNYRRLCYVAGGVLGIYLAKNIFYYFSKSRIVTLAERVAFDLRSEMMAHLHRLSVSYYKRRKPGKISSRLIHDVESIKTFISSEFTKLLINGGMAAVVALAIVTLDPLLAAVALALLPLNVVIYYLFKGYITESAREAKEQVSSISGDLVEQFSGVETMKSAASEDKEREKFATSMRKGMTAQIRERRFYLLQKISSDIVGGLSLVLLFTVGGYLVMTDRMGYGDFAAFYAYIGMLYPLAIRLVADAGKFSSTRASLDRIHDILHTTTDVRELPGARPHPIQNGRIEFQNVSFSFDEQPLLQKVDFTVKAGEHVLITGQSGAGKSTLLNLIPRFYDCNEGQILIDGIDHRDLTLSSLRGQIGFVFQECFLFDMSVIENIRYARPEAPRAAVLEAARQAHAHEFIQNLPQGYETPIGEEGVQLSFGERQRIGIARAILKDPRIFILDEALGSLDPEARRAVSDELAELARNRTLLLVTHNPDLFPGINKKLVIEDRQVQTAQAITPTHSG
jgi:ABC-type bacteriocin/lantibiotic exporter with double-glycine peptidase domain